MVPLRNDVENGKCISAGAAFMRPVEADVYSGPERHKWRPCGMTLVSVNASPWGPHSCGPWRQMSIPGQSAINDAPTT